MKGEVRRACGFMKILCLVALMALFAGSFRFSSYGAAQEGVGNPPSGGEPAMEDYDFGEIQEFLNRQRQSQGWDLSFTDLMKSLMAGDLMEVFKKLVEALKTALFSEVEGSGSFMGQIIVLGIIGAVFTNFSGIFTSSQISETGFFVTYLLLFTFLASSFFTSVTLATQTLNQVLEFMRALLPAYFMAAAFAGGSVTSIALYEAVLFLISSVQWVFLNGLVPLVRIYLLIVMASHIAKEDMLSKLTRLLENVVRWGLKTMTGIVLGVHLIQGMILPYVDSVKNSAVTRLIEVIPGVGQGAGAVAQMVLGSGVLIKNTIGAAAVVILAVLSVVPILKLVVMMLMYQCVAAAMEPVCDKRIISCVSAVAKGHELLLRIVMSAVLLFVLSIAIVCASTNITYYAR